MRGESRQRTTRGCVVLAVTVAALLAQHLAVAGASPWAASDLALLALAGLVVVSLALVATWSAAVPPRAGTGAPVHGIDDPPLLRDRATDPEHHPLAPRAPGLA